MPLPMVGGRVPHALKEKVDSHIKETGMNESEIIREALAQYFNVNTIEGAKSHEKRIADLERKLKKIMTQLIA
jgi:metal-responsive CopG/Arc/MetJ family transcriptional regulator